MNASAPKMSGRTQFLILGALEVRSGDRQLSIGSAKQRGLLAILLLNLGEVVTQDQLIDQLWDGRPPPAAKASLQSRVYRLRKCFESHVLEDVVLRRRASGYAMEVPAESVDMQRFSQLASVGSQELGDARPELAVPLLRKALDLWRGDALADISLQAVRQRAELLGERRLDDAEQCLAAELALKRHLNVVGELREFAVEHPLRERI